jgi:FAD/FMN-containing dehydrogenase
VSTLLAVLAQRLAQRDIDVVRGTDGDSDGNAWRALPDDAEAVARIVREARALQGSAPGSPLRLVPLGGGTRLAAARPDLAIDGALDDTLFIDLARLTGIVEYEPGDGTLTARAGTPWHTLAEAVARGGHELTPDVSPSGPSWGTTRAISSGRSTLGVVIGAGASGPDRIQRGPVRHHVLGALVATGSGTLARSGGRLVKNVTGFDVFRLHVGGRGTLGVVCEASLRLMPRAEHEALIMRDGLELAHALEVAERVRRSAVQPRALFVTNVLRDGQSLAVHLAGRTRQVEGDARTILRELGEGAELVTGDAARLGAAQLRDTRARFERNDPRDASLALAVTSVPSAAVAVGRELLAWCKGSGAAPHVVAWPAVARLELALPAPLGDTTDATSLRGLVQRLRALSASVVFAGGASNVARTLVAIQLETPRGGAAWEHALRAGLDPLGLFAPGALAAPIPTGASA